MKRTINGTRATLAAAILGLAGTACAADTYLTMDTAMKASAKDLLFLVTFDKHHVHAEVAHGKPDSFTLKDLDLGLRGLVGFDGLSAFKPEAGESLKYPAAGNFDPHKGSLVFWTAALGYDPSEQTTDGRKRGNIALAHLVASEGSRNIDFRVYEYAERVYFDWRNSEPPGGHGAVARVSVERKGIRKGEWHQFVMTWDDNRVKLYLNGELADDAALPAKVEKTADLMPDDSEKSFIGVKSPFYEDKHEWDVGVDDFAVYSRPLSALEVRNQYVSLLKDKGSRRTASFDLQLNGVVTGANDKLDRLEADFDFAALSPENAAKLANGGIDVSWKLTAPGGAVRDGKWKFTKRAESRIVDGVDKPGKWRLEAKFGGETVAAEILRPSFDWVGNGLGEEDEVPAIWRDFAADGRVVTLWNRRYEFGAGPLPERVFGYGRPVLAKRPRLLVDGKEPVWTAGPTRKCNRSVTYTGTGVAGAAKLSYETVVEFDGFIRFDWKFDDGAKVSSMALDWQVHPDLSRHLMTPCLCEEKGDELAFPYPKAASQVKMLWLAAEKKGGFAYTMANDANWLYDPAKPVFHVNRRTGDCRVDMVTRESALPAGVSYQALFIATPTRPLPERNRLVRYCGPGGIPLVHADGCGRFNSVFTHAPCEDGSFERKYANARPNSLSVYGGVMSLTDREPESNYLGKYWERPGAYSYKMGYETENEKGEKHRERYSSRSACPTTVYTDYLVWCDWKLWTHPLGGKFWQSYFDLCGDSICRNPLHGCRFKDRFGRTIDSFVVLPLRNLIMRDVAVAHKYGKTVILHGQRDYLPFIQGLADYWFPGEQYTALLNRNLFGYTDDVPDDIYRTELNRDLIGIGIIHLPAIGHAVKRYGADENVKYTDAMLSMILLNDIETSSLYAAGRPVWKVWDIYETYGLGKPSAKCHLYWEQTEVKSSDPDVRVTWYEGDEGRRLLVLSNKTKEPRTSRIDASALKPGARAREELEGREIAVENGTFEITVPARNFRLVAIPPKDFYPHSDGMEKMWGNWKPPKCDSAFEPDHGVGASAAPSLRVSLKDSGGGCFIRRFPVKPGRRYRISVRARGGKGVNSLSIGVQRPGGGPVLGSAKAVPDGGWQKLSLALKIPDTAEWRKAAEMLVTLSAAGRGAVAHFDDLEIDELPPLRGTDFTLYNVMPYSPGREAQSAADCVEYMARTGCDLVLYSLTLHPEGKPAMEKVERYVASYRALKRELEGTGVRLGVLVQAILGHWPRVDKDIEDWTRTVNIKGDKVRFCPDDPGFAKYIDETFRLLAKENPAFILTDDDVRAYSHDAECFCAKHVAEFNRRRGTKYTEKELREKVASAKQDDPDYKEFLAMQRDMMNRLVKRFRAAIDSANRKVPAGICVAGEETFLVPPMARAIAAKGQTPVMRVSTGCYCERFGTRLASNLMRTLGFAEYYRGSGIDILDEADTCPQNLWSKSALSFFTHLEVAAFLGYKGAKTWYVNGHRGDVPITRAYTDVLAENSGLLDAIARESASTVGAEGVAIPCFSRFPRWHLGGVRWEMFIDTGTLAEEVLIPFGMPIRAEKDFSSDGVYVVSRKLEVDRFTDADLDRLFSHKVLVSGEAAVALTARGRSDLIGLSAENKKFRYNRERDTATGEGVGSVSPSDNLPFFSDLAEGAETLSVLGFSPYGGSPVFEVAAPGAVLWRNTLGGTVATCAYHTDMGSLHKFSESRKAQFVRIFDRLAGRPLEFVCGNDQDVLVMARRRADGGSNVFVANLNSEPIRSVRLRAPEAASVSVLAPDGTWRPVEFARDGEWVAIDEGLAFYQAKVFKFARSAK